MYAYYCRNLALITISLYLSALDISFRTSSFTLASSERVLEVLTLGELNKELSKFHPKATVWPGYP
jgi:hypothetical protein